MLFFFSFNPRNRVTLTDLLSGLHRDIYELTAQCCGNLNDLAPLCLEVTEDIAFLVLLTNERLDAGSRNTLATKAPDELAIQRTLYNAGSQAQASVYAGHSRQGDGDTTDRLKSGTW